MKIVFRIIGLIVLSCSFFTSAQAQVGTITTASTSCSLTISSCEGDTLTLTPQNQSSYANYKWYFGSVAPANQITAVNAVASNVVATNFASNSPTIKVVANGGTYILTGEYATPAGCSAINDTFTLNFTPRPVANNATLTLCEKTAGSGTADFTLTDADATITGGAAGVAVTYHATLADAQDDTNPLSSPYTSVTKTLYARVENTTTGCYRTATLSLNINSKPVIADAATTICNGASVDLTTQITNYATFSNPVWTLTTVGGSAVATPTAVTPSLTTTYVLVAENGNVCKDTANVIVTVNPKPVITDASTTICEGTSVNLTSLITNYASYSNPTWTLTTVGGTAVTTPTAATPSVGTTYVLVAENANGCKDTANVIVTLNPLPVANTASTTLCENVAGNGQATFDLTILNATVKGGATDVVVTYHATLADAQSGSNSLNALSYTSTATTIYARVGNVATNCYSTSAITLNVNPKPIIADASTAICNGASIDLTSLITNYASYSNPVWTLTTVGGTSIPNPAAVVPSATMTYVLVAENGSGCKDTANVVVTVNPLPDFTLSKPVACPGTSEDVNITGLTNANSALSQLKIDAGIYATYPNPAMVTGLSVGSHTFSIKNENGCETTKSISISPVVSPICLPVTVTRSVGRN